LGPRRLQHLGGRALSNRLEVLAAVNTAADAVATAEAALAAARTALDGARAAAAILPDPAAPIP
jgi:hypothetical protein